MDKIKIVTAFFDIGRQNYETHSRSNSQYFEYFKFWARIKNEMVIYCNPENAETIMDIRKGFGLEAETEIVKIENVYDIEPLIFSKMTQIQNDENFQSFRYLYKDPSNHAEYDYIMFIKAWCMADTARRTQEDCFIAWIDFGFNHGGKKYTNSEDFNFTWKYSFPSKINLFCLSDPDEVCLIDCLQFQTDCIIGGSIISPKELCESFWLSIKESMSSLIDIGCIDDDQILILMAYRRNKDIFSIRVCDWFDVFLLCSDQNFKTKVADQSAQNIVITPQKANIFRLALEKMLWCYRRIRYPDFPEKKLHPFLERMQIKKNKYYKWDK